jgi:hypothetical protein
MNRTKTVFTICFAGVLGIALLGSLVPHNDTPKERPTLFECQRTIQAQIEARGTQGNAHDMAASICLHSVLAVENEKAAEMRTDARAMMGR